MEFLVFPRLLLFIGIANIVQCSYVYEKIGDGYYFIANGNENDTDVIYFDWFEARESCRSHSGQLLSVESAQQLLDLQNYIVAAGYANGSTFFTSGHSFFSNSPFTWDALQQRVTYTKWLAGEAPPRKSYLGLQLINSELFMRCSNGADQYYICQYEPICRRLLVNLRKLDLTLMVSVFATLIVLYAILWLVKRHKQNQALSSYENLKTVDV
ncbi:uncharacterized protein LOC108599175 isoform X1 [Drosophila busckii]|uniref:uncharacterized protein LOC108599175 isoform X1 n=1 Tax=Drosophila busckii TaxID=30019 RepID=UPI0014331AF0|nr:uncharacterized protein LOC108599175 isoform X1 [Drosophila busckii]